MSEHEFANLYIERIVGEVVELTKIRLMNETRIIYLEKMNADLQAQITAINTQIEPQYNEVEQAKIKVHQRKVKTDNF